MTQLLEDLKYLLTKHFDHQDWIISHFDLLSLEELKELQTHMLSHPHAKKLNLVSSESLENIKTRMNELQGNTS